MKNATGTGLRMAEQEDRNRPDTGPEREDVRGVADAEDDFEDEDDNEDDNEDEGSF